MPPWVLAKTLWGQKPRNKRQVLKKGLKYSTKPVSLAIKK